MYRHFNTFTRAASTARNLALLTASLIAAFANPAHANDAEYRRHNDLDIKYRDMGVIIHHTRQPFKTSSARFEANIKSDPNWSHPTVMPGWTRAADSIGRLVRGRAAPVDVTMAVLRARGASGSTCVVSYRGTDRDHKFDKAIKKGARMLEHLVPASTRATRFRGRGKSCVVKDGYLQNYLETRSQVMDFLDDAMQDGQCSRGVVLLGMSLGGATASVAFSDLMMVRSAAQNSRLRALVEAKKIWLVTAGARRATSRQCASDVHRIAGTKVKRFVYGSLKDETSKHGRRTWCARFVDPVPGNPTVFTHGATPTTAGHFGRAVVGHNTYTGTNPSTPRIGFAARKACNKSVGCRSKRFANSVARVASRTAVIDLPADAEYPRIGRDSGASCTALGLIPKRDYMFGRLHDTCSYRNLMAVYGRKHTGEPNTVNHACPLPRDADDPSNHPHQTCPLGRDGGALPIDYVCPVKPIRVRQFHQR